MCGILFFRHLLADKYGIKWEETLKYLKSRGPDYQKKLLCNNEEDDKNNLLFYGAVLHIQGESLTQQPIIDKYGNILLWNGEAFGGEIVDNIAESTSDTTEIMKQLENELLLFGTFQVNNKEIANILMKVLGKIEGPYALIYYHKNTSTVFYCRDPYGRRSLITIHTNNELIGITSVVANFNKNNGGSDGDGGNSDHENDVVITEVPPAGIHMLDLSNNTDNNSDVDTTEMIPWPASFVRLGCSMPVDKLNINSAASTAIASASTGTIAEEVEGSIESIQEPSVPTSIVDDAAKQLHLLLQSAVQRRVDRFIDTHTSNNSTDSGTSSPIGVLFSGGVDSAVVAALLHHSLPPTLSIDLINVAFVGDGDVATQRSQALRAPDRLSAIICHHNLENAYPSRCWRLIHVDVDATTLLGAENHIQDLIAPRITHMDLNIGTAFWFGSRGVGYLRSYSKDEVFNVTQVSIDGRPLVRVGAAGFAASRGQGSKTKKDKKKKNNMKNNMKNNKCKSKYNQNDNGDDGDIDDGGSTAKIDEKIEIEVETESTSTSVGITAERLSEILFTNTKTNKIIKCEAKALLLGIGADELLAGYGRHRTCWQRGGASALCAELNMDQERIWKRNLGRDDRCISDHGREGWFPFLDEQVVSFLKNLPLEIKADFTLPPGEGDKRLLRMVAKELGIDTEGAAGFVKRAIQFGTRLAKHTNERKHGSNRKGGGEVSIFK